jgi:ferredoxin-NADP reductase
MQSMVSNDEWISARLRSLKNVARDVRLFEIAPDEGVWSYQPGGHIDVSVIVDGEQATRSYSLVGEPNAEVLSIAVKRLPNSRGGSKYMWSLKSGARLAISRPKNHFELSVGQSEYLLVAGGIGITPIYGMALSLLRGGSSFRLIYAARSRADMAFADHLSEVAGSRLQLYPEDSHGRVDLAAEIRALATDAEIYVCGPVGMLEAVKRCWREQWRPQEKLRFETFGSTGHHPSEEFVVSIPHLQREFVVPRNRSLLEALEAEGVEMISNCRRGECGVCVVNILGADCEIDHRDVFFSELQKAEKRKMCTCVSRAVGGRLVIETADR